MSTPRPRQERTILLLVLLAGAVLLGSEVREGWFPHDEGALGQSAVRVLAGEVPHRDFAEIYTGLLSYLNAAVFTVLPVSSLSMRVPLFLAALCWLWAMYRILLRFVPPRAAGVAAVTAFVWGVPNYPSPLPSWYILFLTTGAALALLRWMETPRRRWLVLAGLCGGVAFLFKLTGIFILLGAGLGLLALESQGGSQAGSPGPAPDGAQDEAHDGTSAASGAPRGIYPWAVTAVLILAAAALGVVTGRADREFVRFALPTILLCTGVAARVMRPTGLGDGARWRRALERFGPLLLGAAVPVLLYCALQATLGALPALLEGVFVTPFRRSTYASMRPPALASLVFFVPVAALLWARSTGRRAERVVPVLAALWLGAVLLLSGTDRRFYQLGWLSAWGMLFFVAIDGMRFLRGEARTEPAARAGAIVLACLAVSAALVEYPFAAPIYVLYALPLALVAAVALVHVAGRVTAGLQAVLLLFFLGFGLLRMLPVEVQNIGQSFVRGPTLLPLELPRSGLLVTPMQSVVYEDMIHLVQAQAAGRPIWAGPDAPEIYFLSGLPNRTRTFFEFLDPPEEQATPLVERLDALGVGVAVLKLRPDFWPRPTKATMDSLRPAFPHQRKFLDYVVYWR